MHRTILTGFLIFMAAMAVRAAYISSTTKHHGHAARQYDSCATPSDSPSATASE